MTPTPMPALFIGHGSPMNAIEENEFSLAWQAAARQIPTPTAILCISAHWETHGAALTAGDHPRTIHDFMGFPRELFEKRYPAPGSADLTARVQALVRSQPVRTSGDWGFDHGAWSVLCRMYPEANIPLVQLSLDRNLSPEAHYALGRELRPLRDEGVLVLGSGNVVHNLGMMVWEDRAFDWAVEYDAHLRQWILDGDHDAVIHYERHGRSAQLAVNSGEHYQPLLYILAQQAKSEPVGFFAEKIWGGSLSMRCLRVG